MNYPQSKASFWYAFNICAALGNLVPFVQFRKHERHPWRSATFIVYVLGRRGGQGNISGQNMFLFDISRAALWWDFQGKVAVMVGEWGGRDVIFIISTPIIG